MRKGTVPRDTLMACPFCGEFHRADELLKPRYAMRGGRLVAVEVKQVCPDAGD